MRNFIYALCEEFGIMGLSILISLIGLVVGYAIYKIIF
jgi:hypothetical protein